jgi:hypothetical protein
MLTVGELIAILRDSYDPSQNISIRVFNYDNDVALAGSLTNVTEESGGPTKSGDAALSFSSNGDGRITLAFSSLDTK